MNWAVSRRAPALPTHLGVNEAEDRGRLELLVRPRLGLADDRLGPEPERLARLEVDAATLVDDLLVRIAGPVDLPQEATAEEDDEVVTGVGEWDGEEAGDVLESGRVLNVKVGREVGRSLDVGERLHPEVLEHRQRLLRIGQRTEDLGLVADAQHAIVGVEEGEQVFGLGDDVARRIGRRRLGVDQLARLQPLGVGQALDVAADRVGQQATDLSDRRRRPHSVSPVGVTGDEAPQ